MKRKLLCYAFGRDERWEAICVDFDLAVHGTSFRNVQDRLNAMIESYVADALKESEADAKRLLHRRAPFVTRTRLAVNLFWKLIATRNDTKGDYFAGYDISCRA